MLFTTGVLEALARRQGLQKCRTERQYLPLTLNRFAKINQIPGDVYCVTLSLREISFDDNPRPINETTTEIEPLV